MSNSRTAVGPDQEFINTPMPPKPPDISYPPDLPIPPPPPPPKVGWRSSEFWMHVFVQLVAVVFAMGFLTPDEATQWQQVAIHCGGLVASLLSVIKYTSSRTSIKNNSCY